MQKQQHQQQKNGPAKPTNKQTPEVWLHSPGMTPMLLLVKHKKYENEDANWNTSHKSL